MKESLGVCLYHCCIQVRSFLSAFLLRLRHTALMWTFGPVIAFSFGADAWDRASVARLFVLDGSDTTILILSVMVELFNR